MSTDIITSKLDLTHPLSRHKHIHAYTENTLSHTYTLTQSLNLGSFKPTEFQKTSAAATSTCGLARSMGEEYKVL